MPLSEDEQRILDEIAQQLYASDPTLARGIADTTIYTDASRHLKRGVVLFVVGLVATVATLHISFWLSALGVAVMFWAALTVEANARRLGRAGLDQVSSTLRAAGLRDVFGDRRRRGGADDADDPEVS